MTTKKKKQIITYKIVSIALCISYLIIFNTCAPKDKTSSSGSKWGTAKTFTGGGVSANHYISLNGKLHSYSPFSPCSSTGATSPACYKCHSTSSVAPTALNGQAGWTANDLTVYNPPSCTKCHAVKWAKDAKWDSINSRCNP